MRLANRSDLTRIVEIYNSTIHSRMATADIESVSVESKRQWFLAHSKTRPIFVEEIDADVIAWISLESFYGRSAYHLTAEVSIYVDAGFRSKGVGSKLLQALVKRCPSLGLKNLVAYIFSHNIESLTLFKKVGFSMWGELPYVAEFDGRQCNLSILGMNVSMHKNKVIVKPYRQEISDELMALLLVADPDKAAVLSYCMEAEILVAMNRATLLGVGVLAKENKIYTLKNLSVVGQYQRKGIARLLIAALKKLAKKKGGSILEVGTGNSSLPALALYQKCGFRIHRIERKFFDSYPEPIFENGIRCIDKVCLRVEL